MINTKTDEQSFQDIQADEKAEMHTSSKLTTICIDYKQTERCTHCSSSTYSKRKKVSNKTNQVLSP